MTPDTNFDDLDVIRMLAYTDRHGKAQSAPAVELLYKCAELYDPHILVDNGDSADMASLSLHPPGPESVHYSPSNIEEISELQRHLKRIESCTDARLYVFNQGNHEDRFERHAAAKAPAFAEMIGTFDMAAGISDRGWLYNAYNAGRGYFRVPHTDLHIMHAPPKEGMHSAKNSAREAGYSILYGHLHTMTTATHALIDGRKVSATCMGFLGDIDHPGFGYRRKRAPWQLGFCTVLIDRRSGQYHIQTHPIWQQDGRYSVRMGDAIVSVSG